MAREHAVYQKWTGHSGITLQAHEDGRVVFFCGAGISYPAGLPGFSGLVNKVYSDVGATPNDVEQTALDGALYDTAISLLENRIVGNRCTVRAALAKVLTPDLSLPNATTTHEALITLSKTLKGQFRLITTNFDRLFIEARGRLKTEFHEFSAPLLPVPKKKWDGLVYLHGLLPEYPKNAELDRLVVSSGDFGLAYLTERWAARFVSELFRNYTICFVGYSLNDPVLRYMTDALAADRLLGEVPLEVFAFGNCARGQEDRVTNEWRAWMRLTRWSDWSRSNWDAVMTQIGRWLARHLANPKLLVWVAQRGGHLAERFEHLVSEALDSAPPHPLMESLWRLAIAGRLRDESQRLDLYDWNRRFLKTGLTPMLRLELRDILSPHVKVREGYQSEDDDQGDHGDPRRRHADRALVLGAQGQGSRVCSPRRADRQGRRPDRDATEGEPERLHRRGVGRPDCGSATTEGRRSARVT